MTWRTRCAVGGSISPMTDQVCISFLPQLTLSYFSSLEALRTMLRLSLGGDLGFICFHLGHVYLFHAFVGDICVIVQIRDLSKFCDYD